MNFDMFSSLLFSEGEEEEQGRHRLQGQLDGYLLSWQSDGAGGLLLAKPHDLLQGRGRQGIRGQDAAKKEDGKIVQK